MYKRFLLSLTVVMLVCLLPIQVFASSGTKKKSDSSDYVFVSTDGEICSASVTTTLTQKYSKSSTKTVYGYRTVWVGYTYVATYTIPSVSATNPVYRNSSNTTIKTFDWSYDSSASAYPAGTKVVLHRKNSTSVTYTTSATRYLTCSYTVGNSSFVLTPYKSNCVKLSI